MRKLLGHLPEICEDATTRALGLTGNERSFAAGADIKEMADIGTIEALRVHKLWRAIASCPKPVIAAVLHLLGRLHFLVLREAAGFGTSSSTTNAPPWYISARESPGLSFASTSLA